MTPSPLEFRVPDMHCEGCTARVTRVLERLEGVRSATVTLEDKTAEVAMDDGAVGFEDVRDAVEKAGYTVEA